MLRKHEERSYRKIFRYVTALNLVMPSTDQILRLLCTYAHISELPSNVSTMHGIRENFQPYSVQYDMRYFMLDYPAWKKGKKKM